MKTFMLILAFAFIQLTSFAQSEGSAKTETVEFKVYGNCGMCKSRIEKALKVDGVESAKWNSESKMVSVVFNSEKISEENLHQLVAAVGHDTEIVKAKDETYSKLHGCCKYERANSNADDNKKSDTHKH